ncbi:MAG: hypothetical protein KGR26_16385, partial [Cyanobacteria bacterium REEB65]|nr:hypothetical protein [Cyanobacteria bacterium REEB65]
LNASKNLEMLAVVARGLRELKDRVVFVGGATVDLYISNPSGSPLRTTDDVDCVIAITSRLEYNKLEERLRALEFTHPMGDPKAPICRWRYAGIIVDVMPLERSVLGFSNRWYPEGVEHAEKRTLPDGQQIEVFTLPYFLASKIEAFRGRGESDFYGSEDIEDILSVLDGADDVQGKLANASEGARAFIGVEFRSLLGDDLFVQSIPGHLGTQAGPGRVQRVLKIMSEVVQQQA